MKNICKNQRPTWKFVFGGVIIACVTIYFTYLYWPGERTITRFYNNDSAKITKIEYVSGSDGVVFWMGLHNSYL